MAGPGWMPRSFQEGNLQERPESSSSKLRAHLVQRIAELLTVQPNHIAEAAFAGNPARARRLVRGTELNRIRHSKTGREQLAVASPRLEKLGESGRSRRQGECQERASLHVDYALALNLPKGRCREIAWHQRRRLELQRPEWQGY